MDHICFGQQWGDRALHNAAVKDTETANSVTYTKRTSNRIRTANDACTCTSGITDISLLLLSENSFIGNNSSGIQNR